MGERRDNNRSYIIADIKVIPVKQGSKPIGGEVVDINSGGVGVYLWTKVTQEEFVDVELTFRAPDGEQQTEHIKGEVLWVRKVGNRYSAGIKFGEIASQENFPALSSFVAENPDTEEEEKKLEESQLFACKQCRSEVKVTREGKGELVCCGQNMELI